MQRISRSTIIHAPIEQVWSVLRDFNSHDQWHSAIASSHIEGQDRSDQVGCVRSFTLKDGNRIREQLIALDDAEHRSTYCIVESTVPLQRYVATITLRPVTDSRSTFWHWESSFQTPPGMERELSELVAQGVYQAGFGDLQRHLALGADRHISSASQAAGQAQASPLPSRRVVLKHYGEPAVMSTETAEARAPGPGEVRIAQRAVGVNFFDIYLRRGWMPDLMPLPGTPGMEAAGAIIDVGPGVTEWLPGDRVAYLGPQPGAYASVRTVPSDWVVRLPPTVQDATAAALLLKGCTADFLLRDLGHVGPGTRLLVHGAAGGLGLLVCAWARHMGATVIGTVSSEAKARAARQAGCQHVVITSDYRFAREVQHLGGAQVIVDGLGGAAASENLEALARTGHWISVGQASGPLPTLSPDALVAKSATFSRPVVFDYVATPSALAERADRVWQALVDGSLPTPTIERFSLDAADQAHQRMESRGAIGSLVLLP